MNYSIPRIFLPSNTDWCCVSIPSHLLLLLLHLSCLILISILLHSHFFHNTSRGSDISHLLSCVPICGNPPISGPPAGVYSSSPTQLPRIVPPITGITPHSPESPYVALTSSTISSTNYASIPQGCPDPNSLILTLLIR